MSSPLESKYIEATRPYSQKELQINTEMLYKKLRIGKTVAHHTKCQHFYLVKKNGRKEKEIIESNTDVDVGNCSVCWKINKTPKNLKNSAIELTNEFMNRLYTKPEYLTYNLLDLETTFYNWLYEEIKN